MTEKQKRELLKQMHKLTPGAGMNDALVVCEDGVETNNIYPIWQACQHSPDTKTAEDWIRGIAFEHTMKKRTCEVSLILKKDAGAIHL